MNLYYMFLYMKRKRLIIGIVCFILLIAILLYFRPQIRAFLEGFDKRVAGAYQWVDELAEEVRSEEQLASLQDWADKVLESYSKGTLKTLGPSSYWAKGTLKIDPSEIDPDIRMFWSKPAFGSPPEAVIKVSKSGEALYVGYCWYLKGVIIAGPNYPCLDFEHFYAVEAKPDIFAYSIEK